MAIADEIVRLQSAKANIKASIEAKGVEVPEGSIETYPALIDEIKTQGNYQEKTVTPTKELQIINPDEGFDALKSVLVKATPLQEETVTPSRDTQNLVPSNNNIGFSKVTVNGDSNLFPSNIKKGTSIFGITGTYEGEAGGGGGTSGGGDYSKLGVPITVETRNSFYAGDRFVGVKNDGHVAKTIVSTQLAADNIASSSDDLRVCVMSQTLTNDSSTLRIGFLNSETNEYEPYDVDLPSMNFAAGFTLNGTNTQINEDGSLIGICSKDAELVYSSFNGIGILIINVDVENKTASASYKGNYYRFGDHQFTSGNYTYDVTDSSIYYNNTAIGFFVIGKYILLSSTVRCSYYDYTDALKGTTLSFNSLYAVSKSIPLHKFVGNGSYLRNFVTCAMRGENTIIAAAQTTSDSSYKGILFRYKVSGTTLESASVNADHKATVSLASISVGARFSSNGQYISLGSSTSWGISLVGLDLSVTSIGGITLSKTASVLRPDSTGTQAIFDTGAIYNYNGSTFVSGGTAPTPSSRYFDLKNGFYRSNKNKVFLSPQSSEPEYIISNTQAYIETADRVYGIVPKDMIAGEIGIAQGLFNTFNL